eukprot:2398052-Prorocentrum_lima.AAC.1
MTSSLVGSEMCIRDRHKRGSHRRRGKPTPHNPQEALRGRRKRRSTQLRAVSYTHLTLPTICSV